MLIRNTIGALGAAVLRGRAGTTMEATISALPGLSTWLDPSPEFTPSVAARIEWRARYGTAVLTQRSTTEAAIQRATINGQPALACNGSGLLYPRAGRMLSLPAGGFSLFAVAQMTVTTTRHILGPVHDRAMNSSDPRAFNFGVNSERMRVWAWDFGSAARSSPGPSISGVMRVLGVSFSSSRGYTFWNSSATPLATESNVMTDVIDRRLQLLAHSARPAGERFLGTLGPVLILAGDYSEPQRAGALSDLMGALMTGYGVLAA